MTQYILKPSVVKDCFWRLVEAPIHRLFPGYLCLQQQAVLEGRTKGLSFPYNDFFDSYFQVIEGDKPYLVPFTQAENPSETSLWFNENVAGTYAPSSLRSSSPLMQVATLEEGGHNAKWALKTDHWKLARLNICDDEKIPIESLSAYLFRDYAFDTDDPTAYTLVSAFSEEFGYDIGGTAFAHLYETGDSDITEEAFKIYE